MERSEGEPPTDRFRRQRRRDTQAELALRKALHAGGLRYRTEVLLAATGGRRRADIVFGPARVAVFVDGCFWHACPVHGSMPKSNADWWRQKLERNTARDRDTDRRLIDAGWLPIRVWEHEDPAAAAIAIAAVVQSRRPRARPRR